MRKKAPPGMTPCGGSRLFESLSPPLSSESHNAAVDQKPREKLDYKLEFSARSGI